MRRRSGCCIQNRSLWHQNPPVLDAGSPSQHAAGMSDHITREELRELIDADAVTVVEALAAALLPDKDAAIVTYCSNTACANSRVALAQLRRLGYTDVRVYAEGKQ